MAKTPKNRISTTQNTWSNLRTSLAQRKLKVTATVVWARSI